MKIIKLNTLKTAVLKLVGNHPQRSDIKKCLVYSGILDAIGPFVLYHIDGTNTVMIDEHTATTILRKIQEITNVDYDISTRCQRLPNNHVCIQVNVQSDLSALNVIRNDPNLINEHSIKLDKQKRAVDRARNQYRGASRLLKRLKTEMHDKKYLCIDVEAFERRQTKLLEVGASLLENGHITTRHFIVQGNMRYRNGSFVADNRDNFMFGESEILPLTEISRIVVDMINDVDVLVGHSFEQDQKYLSLHIANIRSKPVVDTAGLAKCLISSPKRSVGLKEVMDLCGIKYDYLHNGGNDAHFTLQTLVEMVTMTPYKELKEAA